MESRITILKELQEISPVVANIGNQVPYQVPAGYFEALAGKVMEEVVASTTPPVQLTIGNQNVYTVPQGYFEGLATDILNKVKATETTTQLAISNDNVYDVPKGYFDDLAGSILNRIKATEATSPKEELSFLSPLLHQAEKKNPFSTPAGYFNELSGNVVAGVQAIAFVNEELENLSPLMSDLKTKNAYEVPAGYFEQFPVQVLNKIKQPAGKVVSMSFGRKVMRYAVAAMIVGFMAVGGWLLFKPAPEPGKSIANANPVNVQAGLKPLSDDEILNGINTNSIALADIGTQSSGEITEADTKDLFADVTDEELQKYLEEHGANTNTSIAN